MLFNHNHHNWLSRHRQAAEVDIWMGPDDVVGIQGPPAKHTHINDLLDTDWRVPYRCT
jgi:hypothetical protein